MRRCAGGGSASRGRVRDPPWVTGGWVGMRLSRHPARPCRICVLRTPDKRGKRRSSSLLQAARSVLHLERVELRVMSSGAGPPRVAVSRASIAATSSGVNAKSKMSKFSSMRCGLTDFGIAETPCPMCQRSTTCAAVLPWFAASSTIVGCSSGFSTASASAGRYRRRATRSRRSPRRTRRASSA
jgi:hypothetical protein